MIKKIHNNKGFSLIEIMAAFSIVSLVFIGLMQAFPYGLSINKTAENSTVASFLAQGEIESVRSLGYVNIPLGTVAKHRMSSDTNDYRYFFQEETVVTYVDSNLNTSVNDQGLKKISVTIYFTNSISKEETSYNITTLISQL